MKKVLLIDGNSMMSIAYYGNLPREVKDAKRRNEDESNYYHLILRNSKGRYTNGLLGMTKNILHLINDYGFTHVAIAWDVTRDTFRRTIYPDYKSSRSETPEPLREQIKTEQAALEFAGIYTIKSNPEDPIEMRFEGDDLLGTVAAQLEKEDDIQIYIYTKDQDCLQLASNKTTIWRPFDDEKKVQELRMIYNLDPFKVITPNKVFPFTPSIIKEEYKVYPHQIPDMKGLEGDKSDDIPGVPSVGEKSARPLLQQYGSIEKIYEAIDEQNEVELKNFWKNDLYIKKSPYGPLVAVAKDSLSSIKKETLSSRELAFLSKELATIKRDCPIGKINLDDLKINIDREKLMKFLRKYELNSIINNLDDFFTPKSITEIHEEINKSYEENNISIFKKLDYLTPLE